MTTRNPTGRTIQVPALVGVRADRAIETLRELGLLPIVRAEEVRDVKEAGVVLGLDPPAGELVRPRAFVTICVAAHRDFDGHADDRLAGDTDEQTEPTLATPEMGGRSEVSPMEHPDEAPPQEQCFLPMRLW